MRKAALLLILGLLMGETRKDLLLRIRLLEREIALLEKRSKGISDRLERISAEINLINARIALETQKLREIDLRIKEGKLRIEDLQGRIETLRKRIKTLALFLYKRRWTETHFLLELFSFRDPTYLLYLQRRITGAYKKYRELMEEKRAQEESLGRAYREKKQLLRSLRWRRWRLKRARQRLKQELSRVLQDREKKRKLLQEIRSPDLNFQQEERPPAVKRGEMLWPLRGRIVRRFGFIIHPVFHTRVKSTGIEIKPSGGQEYVRAAAAGVVEFVSRFSGYGRVVILSHGGRIYTVYGHLLEVFVKKGQEVKAGQRLGSLGEGAFWKGRTLYFEVRVGGEAQNPLRWLRKR